MDNKPLSELSDEELLARAETPKASPIVTATLIGFMFGVIIYSVVQNTWGLLTLIPIFFIYKLVTGSKQQQK